MQPAVAALADHIAAHATATEALDAWCRIHLPQPDTAPDSRIIARVLQDQPLRHDAYSGPLLLHPAETLRHRRVHLLWHGQVVAEAENWYLPDRLPPALRQALLRTDTPFGAVLRPLTPRRVARAIRPGTGTCVLRIDALVDTAGTGQLADVCEQYRHLLVADMAGE